MINKQPHNRIGNRIAIADNGCNRNAKIKSVNVNNLVFGVVEEITVEFEDNGEIRTVPIRGIRIGNDWIR